MRVYTRTKMAHSTPKPTTVFVLTVSDTRTEADDPSGALCQRLVAAAGHTVTGYAVVPDEPAHIAARCAALCDAGGVGAILLSGGTGISTRDTTIEAIAPLLDRRLDGFGELFRMLSFADVGSRAMASRAIAGVRKKTILFAMPGSEKAVKLALERLIVPELGHLCGELSK